MERIWEKKGEIEKSLIEMLMDGTPEEIFPDIDPKGVRAESSAADRLNCDRQGGSAPASARLTGNLIWE